DRGHPVRLRRPQDSVQLVVAAAVAAPVRSSATDLGGAPRRQTNTAWSRFRRDRVAAAALVVLSIFVLLAIFAPCLAPDPFMVYLDAFKKPPNATHWLGTASAGRDVFARLLFGARVSMSVGL